MIYILFDSAKNGVVALCKLQERYPEWKSLFAHTTDEMLFDVAPYLFKIDDQFLNVAERGNIGIENILIVESTAEMEELLVHFQQFIYNKNEETGQLQYFRFWDAVVAENNLKGKGKEWLKFFFGKVIRYIIPHIEEEGMSIFFLEKEELLIKRDPITELFTEENEAVSPVPEQKEIAVPKVSVVDEIEAHEQKAPRRFF